MMKVFICRVRSNDSKEEKRVSDLLLKDLVELSFENFLLSLDKVGRDVLLSLDKVGRERQTDCKLSVFTQTADCSRLPLHWTLFCLTVPLNHVTFSKDAAADQSPAQVIISYLYTRRQSTHIVLPKVFTHPP